VGGGGGGGGWFGIIPLAPFVPREGKSYSISFLITVIQTGCIHVLLYVSMLSKIKSWKVVLV